MFLYCDRKHSMSQPLPKVAQAYRIIFVKEKRYKEVDALSSNTESLAFTATDRNSFKQL